MKLITLEEAIRQRSGRKLVFTNGVFDILHVGHVRYLQQARGLGDMLMVGLNSDESVRKLGKGPGRPINTLEERAEVVAALRAVDAVIGFDEPTPVAVIAALRPEVHVKGGDYQIDELPELETVRSYGGQVVILPFVPGHSTTTILK